jgi:multiple sugar transport system permease protein
MDHSESGHGVQPNRARQGLRSQDRRSARRKVALGKVLAVVTLLLIGLFSVFPILWLILTGFKPAWALTSKTPVFVFVPTLEHYESILSPARRPATAYFMNSLVISMVSTVVSITLAVFAAYALARLRPKGYRQLSYMILSMRLLPPIALIVPFYFIANRLSIYDTRMALIIAYTALNVPLATWLLQGFLVDLPGEMEEAAMVDGCTHMGAFFRVILPLAGPGLAAASVFAFVLAWNDLAIALSLAPFEATTMPVLASRVRTDQGINWGELGALTTLIMAPAILFTFVASRWLVKGLTSGAVKG